jgi:hypothetical protein
MKHFEGIWQNDAKSQIKLLHQTGWNYLLQYYTGEILHEESIEISIESEAFGTVSYCKRFSNGVKENEATVYIVGEDSAIIGGESFISIC